MADAKSARVEPSKWDHFEATCEALKGEKEKAKQEAGGICSMAEGPLKQQIENGNDQTAIDSGIPTFENIEAVAKELVQSRYDDVMSYGIIKRDKAFQTALGNLTPTKEKTAKDAILTANTQEGRLAKTALDDAVASVIEDVILPEYKDLLNASATPPETPKPAGGVFFRLLFDPTSSGGRQVVTNGSETLPDDVLKLFPSQGPSLSSLNTSKEITWGFELGYRVAIDKTLSLPIAVSLEHTVTRSNAPQNETTNPADIIDAAVLIGPSFKLAEMVSVGGGLKLGYVTIASATDSGISTEFGIKDLQNFYLSPYLEAVLNLDHFQILARGQLNALGRDYINPVDISTLQDGTAGDWVRKSDIVSATLGVGFEF
ncbi:MAG: hypothetical protein HY540_07965 [Deltaproteobacteria bacterium]|nr:hypothetical protein [Deltaproteobacteria bacterium]